MQSPPNHARCNERRRAIAVAIGASRSGDNKLVAI